MAGWREIQDNVIITGTVESYQLSDSDGDWCITIKPDLPYEDFLINTSGNQNIDGYIECEVRPDSNIGFKDFIDNYWRPLLGRKVTIGGTWVEDIGHSDKTEIHPISFILFEKGISYLEDTEVMQAVKDIELFVFSDDSSVRPLQIPPILLTPPHSNENRIVKIDVPFPRTPTLSATPIFQLYSDSLIDRVENKSFSIETDALGNHHLIIEINSGITGDSKGTFYGEIGLSFEETLDDICQVDECSNRPGFSCQFTGAYRFGWIPSYVPMALKGDVVMSPDNGSGTIGTMLSALNPPQVYDHCGIFIDNGHTIRHCTGSDDRLKKKEYYNGSITISDLTGLVNITKPAPVNGVREDIMKYVWPGTINQTIDEIYFTGRNTLNDQFSFWKLNSIPRKKLFELRPSDREKVRYFVDPEHPKQEDFSFSLRRLSEEDSFHNVIKETFFPCLVQPSDEGIRIYLELLAEMAVEINGHYRFYGYSNAKVAIEPDGTAPSKSDAFWNSFPSGANWAGDTIGMVCSSFIWVAFQNLKRKIQGDPTFLPMRMEGIVIESPPKDFGAEISRLTEDDGLYIYREDERVMAGIKLYNKIKKEATQSVNDEKDFASGLVNILSLGSLNAKLDRIPNYIANQLTMTFAFDKPVNDDAWRRAGDGLAVSPDDIKNYWDSNNDRDEFQNIALYGTNRRLVIEHGHWGKIPIYKMLPTNGLGILRGLVLFENHIVSGAIVAINCKKVVSTLDGYSLQHDAGKYTAQASWQSIRNPKIVLKSKIVELEIIASDTVRQNFIIEPPEIELYRVFGSIQTDIEDDTIFTTRKGSFGENFEFELKYDLRDEFQITPIEQLNSRVSGSLNKWSTEVGSGVCVHFEIDFSLDVSTKKLSVKSLVTLFDKSENETDQTQANNFVLNLNANKSINGSLKSDDIIQERATFKYNIEFEKKSILF